MRNRFKLAADPGRYILEVETTDALRKPSEAVVSDWIDFQIR